MQASSSKNPQVTRLEHTPDRHLCRESWCWTKALQRKAVRLKPSDVVTVRGALRRRFWRSPGGPASRYEVEATGLDRCVVPKPAT
jgi:hypothetical protein